MCLHMLLQIDAEDKYAYIGTTTGDVIIVNVRLGKLRGTLPPVKRRFNQGVTAIGQFRSGEFVVGAGDGTVCLCDPLFNRTACVCQYSSVRLLKSVTAFTARKHG